LTLGQLEDRARNIAAWLEAGVPRGAPVLLVLPSGPEFVPAFLGCLKAQRLAVPLPFPTHPAHWARIDRVAADCGARVGLTLQGAEMTRGKHGNGDCTAVQKTRRADDITWISVLDIGPSPRYVARDADPNAVAYLQYTSGSTTVPKGVEVTHRSLVRNIGLFMEAFAITHEDVFVTWLPHFHDMGLVGTILTPLYAGASCVVFSPIDFIHAPVRWLRAITQYRGSVSGAPNFAYDLCAARIGSAERATLDLQSWRVAFNGAEPVRSATIARFTETFATRGFNPTALCPSYGLAEATLIVSANRPGTAPTCLQFDREALAEGRVRPIVECPRAATLVGVGAPVPSGSVAIVDSESLRPVEEDRVGEIWVHGESVAAGYYGRAGETGATFGGRISGVDEPRSYLRTGDLGFMHNGELFITGRSKDIVIVRGQNLYPQDIEETVVGVHPAFRRRRAAAFSIDDGEEVLVVLQELNRRPGPETAEHMVAAMREAVTRTHGVDPGAILLVPRQTIQMTSSGKIARWACREAFLAGGIVPFVEWRRPRAAASILPQVGEEAMAAPQPLASLGALSRSEAIASWLTEVIAKYAGIPTREIRRDVPYSRFGLDSVRSVEIASRLGDWLGESVSPSLLFDQPSIRQTVAALCHDPNAPAHVRGVRMPRVLDASEPIAIIGMACRFPRATDLDEFWRLLRDGRDGIGALPRSRRVDTAGMPPEGGFLEDVDGFDAELFGLAPRVAASLDPQQRLILEVAWHALEHAGCSPSALAGSETGVFIGASHSDHALAVLGDGAAVSDPWAGLAGALSFVANRLSYCLDLKGPSLTIDTACSSSLVALHYACRSLRSHECDLALAGGVNLILLPTVTRAFMRAGLLSADGRCRAFDANASGYGRSEGVGVVVLRRLVDARAYGDRVLAVVRGSAVRQDGRTHGITAPNAAAQTVVVQEALAVSDVPPTRVSYVEAHGTGTQLGDLIELQALSTALTPRPPGRPYAVGSVKTNIGHTEAAAGIAGVIKTVLALQHACIPAHLHLKRPNPNLRFDEATVPTVTAPWPSDGMPRIAGVSSFGIGGTLAHAILEEAPPPELAAKEGPDHPSHVFVLSADAVDAIRAYAARLVPAVREYSDSELGDVCYTAATGRAHLRRRVAAVVHSIDELHEFLDSVALGAASISTISQTKDVAFLFTGQGSQYSNMCRAFYDTEAEFRHALEECDASFAPYIGASILLHLYGDAPSPQLDETWLTQPALFAVEYALAQLWRTWGVRPSALLGHSIGEWTAVTVAEMLSLDDAARLVAVRGRLMSGPDSAGEMLAVRATEAEVASIVAKAPDDLAIAAVNGPRNVVLSGRAAAIAAARDRLSRLGFASQPLASSYAFHSPLMRSIAEPFERALEGVRWRSPKIPVISNLTGQPLTLAEVSSPEYWIRHALGTVRFLDGYRYLRAQGVRLFVELGPDAVLARLGRNADPGVADVLLAGVAHKAATTNQRAAWDVALDTLSALYLEGVEIDWSAFNHGRRRRKVALPLYSFRRHAGGDDIALPPTQLASQPGRHADDASPPGETKVGDRVAWPLPTSELSRRVAAESVSLEAVYRSSGYSRFRETLARLARVMARDALAQVGADARAPTTASGVLGSVAAQHRRYAERLLAHLRDATDLQLSVDDALTAHPEHAGMLRLLKHVGHHVADVLRGALTDTEVLFPEGRIDLLHAAYADDVEIAAVQTLVARLVEEELACSPRLLRILELGAGTGSTLERVISGLDGRQFTYTATDVSRFFLDRIRTAVHTSVPVTTRLLDIAVPPEIQSWQLRAFDVAIAVSVLHATPDLRATLRHLRSLLADDALVVIVEPTTNSAALDLIFGITHGWWAFAGDDARRDSPLLPADRWRALLTQSGFTDVRALPSPGEYDHVVLVARACADGVNRPLRDAVPAIQAESAPPRPISIGGAPGDVAELVRTTLAASLGMEPTRIDATRPFADLGLDSLMAVEVAWALSRALGLRVTAALLFEHPTATQLADYLAGQVAGRTPAPLPTPRAAASIRPEADRAIAVVGFACRFPGAPDEHAFWQLLREGRDAVGEVPRSRWRWNESPELAAARWGGFLDAIELFDPLFFDISPREARVMDPQQRLLLETAWNALESAGYAGEATRGGRVGVFVGCSQNGYLSRISPHLTPSDVAAGIGNQNAIIPNRLSYCLNLRGPSILVDTLCSSSLAAVHLACRSLRDGECDLALAGGVNVLLSPDYYRGLLRMNALARDGRCKAFDARADGFVSGEGVGVVVLKSLNRALADGDTIRGVILGSAMNHDGRTNGLTAPSPAAQYELLRSAWIAAGVTAGDLSLIEAHGTGTLLGDPIEVEGLTRAFRCDTDRKHACALGSVKTNIGHLEPAAGIAGLIKVLLALEHGVIPPTIHFEQPNPRVAFDDTPFFVNTVPLEWEGPTPRRAGVSSFGMGGTNVHLVVEQAPTSTSANGSAPAPCWLPVSARSVTALAAALDQLADFVATNPEAALRDIAYTLYVGRARFAHRAAVLADDWDRTRDRLRSAAALVRSGGSATREILFGLDGSHTGPVTEGPADAFVRGENVDWKGSLAGAARRIPLPTYPFQRRRCWVDPPALNPLLGNRVG
jgi:acyl transferase domain-containing protein/acyl-CoA synthetase (AMP-forming)/AMP-acid ligase II/acyl carrier protein